MRHRATSGPGLDAFKICHRDGPVDSHQKPMLRFRCLSRDWPPSSSAIRLESLWKPSFSARWWTSAKSAGTSRVIPRTFAGQSPPKEKLPSPDYTGFVQEPEGRPKKEAAGNRRIEAIGQDSW